MIVVRGSKGRGEKPDGLVRPGNVPPLHSSGQPASYSWNRWPPTAFTSSTEGRMRLSREVTSKPISLPTHRFRSDGEANHNGTPGFAQPRPPPPSYSRKLETPSSAPPFWESRLQRGVHGDWQQQGRAFPEPRYRATATAWYPYPSNTPLPSLTSTGHSHWRPTRASTNTERPATTPYSSNASQWAWHPSVRQPVHQASIAAQAPPPLTRSVVKHDVPKQAKHPLDAPVAIPVGKKLKGLDKLNLLCQATLEIGPMQDNPSGCSCPKSKCVALYCECFKAGRRCLPRSCGCVDCKNTVAESGVNGARTKAIRSILARNPRAFVTAGLGSAARISPNGEAACNCIRSRCLKLYCSCFQGGKVCNESCTCVGCYNNNDDECSAERQLAVQLCLEKRPDAFEARVKEPGHGCACKNNRCVRKYCECFRSDLLCGQACSCRHCENRSSEKEVALKTKEQ